MAEPALPRLYWVQRILNQEVSFMPEPQNNPFSNMPEPPAAPDPSQVFGGDQGQPQASCGTTGQAGQASGSYGAGQYQAGCQADYQAGYQQPYSQGYQQTGYQQPAYQQAYQQPVAAAQPPVLYPMMDTDRNLRLVAFIFCILSLVGSCWLIIPLAWMIPMSVICWGIYKGTKANTVAFGVCTLIFVNVVAGILLLCSNKDR